MDVLSEDTTNQEKKNEKESKCRSISTEGYSTQKKINK